MRRHAVLRVGLLSQLSLLVLIHVRILRLAALCDAFSLGVTIHHALSVREPFEWRDPVADADPNSIIIGNTDSSGGPRSDARLDE